MTGSAFKAMDVVVACLSYEMGGGLEEGGLKIGPGGRAADDGKRLPGDGRCVSVASRREVLKKGRSLRRGGLKIQPEGTPADDGKRLSGDGRCGGILA